MPITAAQATAFFTLPDQMAIPAASVPALQNEGITTIADLLDFDKTSIAEMAANFRRATPVVIFGAKSQKRLTVACNAVKYYDAIGHPLTAGIMMWTPVLRNFEVQYATLLALKDQDEPDTPRISKALPIMKWSEAFRDYLYSCVGFRQIPLLYVIRENETPANPAPALGHGLPHSIEAGSLIQELIDRASHTHPNFNADNGKVYQKLEEATRGTSYAASIKPFQRRRHGRNAYLAIISQYAGKDKWNLEVKKQDSFLHNRKWKGTGTFPLEKFCSQHRNAHEQLKLAADHVPYQLPAEFTRVGWLLDAIETTDASLLAAIANVHNDDDPTTGKLYNFEATVTYILPNDPVTKRRKRGAAEISSVNAVEEEEQVDVNISAMKVGIGKTGVHFRFYDPTEYKTLNKAQKNELRLWRLTPEGKAFIAASKKTGGKGGSGGKNKNVRFENASISSSLANQVTQAVDKAFDAKLQKIHDESKHAAETKSAMREAVVGALQDLKNESKGSPATVYDKNVLVTMLAKAKNGGGT